MTADATLTVLIRVGRAACLSVIEIRGATATETAFRLDTQPPKIGRDATRSFPTTSVIDEVLAGLPSRSDFQACAAFRVDAAWEAVSAFAAAPAGVAASYAKSMLRWRSVPECVGSLQARVDAEFIVSTRSPAGATERWWVSGDSGWVGLGVKEGQISMVPSSRSDIRDALLTDLVGAISATAV